MVLHNFSDCYNERSKESGLSKGTNYLVKTYMRCTVLHTRLYRYDISCTFPSISVTLLLIYSIFNSVVRGSFVSNSPMSCMTFCSWYVNLYVFPTGYEADAVNLPSWLLFVRFDAASPCYLIYVWRMRFYSTNNAFSLRSATISSLFANALSWLNTCCRSYAIYCCCCSKIVLNYAHVEKKIRFSSPILFCTSY